MDWLVPFDITGIFMQKGLDRRAFLLYNNTMKVKKLIQKYFKAIFDRDSEKEQKVYEKITKKSLKGKKTQRVK